MIVGKEFSNFTNPLYIKSANTVSVNMSPDLSKAKPHYALVIDKPNPIGSTGKINLGFENETDLKTLEGNESDLCPLDSENIQLELKDMDSLNGENNENEEDEKKSKKRGSRRSKNSTMNDETEERNTTVESEHNKTLDSNRVIEKTIECLMVKWKQKMTKPLKKALQLTKQTITRKMEQMLKETNRKS